MALRQGRKVVFLEYAVAGMAGLIIGVAVLGIAGASLTWVIAACLLLLGGIAMLAIGQVRRPCLALLAFAVPFHVGIHFSPYPAYHEGGPSAFSISIADVILGFLCFFGWVKQLCGVASVSGCSLRCWCRRRCLSSWGWSRV